MRASGDSSTLYILVRDVIKMHDIRPVVRVIDFWVAKAIDQSLADQFIYTGVNDMVGTPL